MKKGATFFLQGVIVLFGMVVFALMLIEPNFEGRNANSTLYQVYFNDPFLVYAYLGSIPFFVALYQAFKLLRFARLNTIFSTPAVKALRMIKYCALLLAGAIIGADIFIMINSRATGDDGTGAIMLGIIATFIAIVVATAAAVFERILQKAVELQSENDLTV